jgi:hypothetical protein
MKLVRLTKIYEILGSRGGEGVDAGIYLPTSPHSVTTHKNNVDNLTYSYEICNKSA